VLNHETAQGKEKNRKSRIEALQNTKENKDPKEEVTLS
jgi:hypothetical protein